MGWLSLTIVCRGVRGVRRTTSLYLLYVFSPRPSHAMRQRKTTEILQKPMKSTEMRLSQQSTYSAIGQKIQPN